MLPCASWPHETASGLKLLQPRHSGPMPAARWQHRESGTCPTSRIHVFVKHEYVTKSKSDTLGFDSLAMPMSSSIDTLTMSSHQVGRNLQAKRYTMVSNAHSKMKPTFVNRHKQKADARPNHSHCRLSLPVLSSLPAHVPVMA